LNSDTRNRHNPAAGGSGQVLELNQGLSPEQRAQKRRLVRYVIIGCLALIPLFGYIQGRLLIQGASLPLSSNILIFSLINFNVILLLLMLYLVLRHLVELIFEQRKNILGARLRTKLVVAFISLSLIPTALLFFIALRFVSTSMDYWFNTNVENSLQSSLHLAQSIIKNKKEQALAHGSQIASLLESGHLSTHNLAELETFFTMTLNSSTAGGPDAISLVSTTGKRLVSVRLSGLAVAGLPEIPIEPLRHTIAGGKSRIITQKSSVGELVRSIIAVSPTTRDGNRVLLVTTLLIPRTQLQRMESIMTGINDYRQLIMLKAPIKTSLLIMLLIITLLIIFGATWFGFFIARGITGPIHKLAIATRRVADGELDFVLEKESDDEMGLLVESFNKMTADLAASNHRLAEAHDALRKSSAVADQRRRYMETVLKNVAAGVISIDEHGHIKSINRFAENLLRIDSDLFLNKHYEEALTGEYLDILKGYFRELHESDKSTIERHLRLAIGKKMLSLLVNITQLENDRHEPLGYVIVFDNLTKLEKAQRMAAWREVARRIAHEIKNPLTPIQLSAQRLRKRYLDKLASDGDIFDQSTATIIGQVEVIKSLVSEFSRFARMPKIIKKPGNLIQLAEEIVTLYKEAHKYITFTLTIRGEIPVISFDAIQIKRVLINLLDNAVAILSIGSMVEICIKVDGDGKHVAMAVKDNGPGIDRKDKLRLFEPYFSTKKSGTGLGLAIANTIIAEHGGTIRVRDNIPSGTVFTVMLPIDNN